MKRVVITGVGAITPVGNDAATMWENMKNGVCGIDIISKFDPETSKAKVAAEVKALILYSILIKERFASLICSVSMRLRQQLRQLRTAVLSER